VIAVTFDLRGTLVSDVPCEELALATLVARLCAERGLEAIAEARIAAARAPLAHDLATENMRLETAGTRALEKLLPGHMSAGDGSAFRDLAIEVATRETTALPGATELLERLADLAIPVAILSNGRFALEAARASAIGAPGPVLVPPRGAWKPSPKAFAMLPDLFRLTPDRIWHVSGDAENDIAGARAAGLNAVWLAGHDAPYPPDIPQPTHRIARLSEIIDIIAGPYTASALALRRLLIT